MTVFILVKLCGAVGLRYSNTQESRNTQTALIVVISGGELRKQKRGSCRRVGAGNRF